MNLALTLENFQQNCLRLNILANANNVKNSRDLKNKKIITNNGDPTVWLGFSGGVDSRVLLELCHALSTKQLLPKLIAVHINHKIHQAADDWENFCLATCNNLKVKFYSKAIDPSITNLSIKQGLEAALRSARLAIWQQLLSPGDFLLLGQHLNDQIETLFLRLLRGAGIKGLAAMHERSQYNNLTIIRPLLKFTKTQILNFAKSHKLAYIEDNSNYDQKFSRNFVRHTILPKLLERDPASISNIARTIENLQQADQYIMQQAIAALGSCYIWPSSANNYLRSILLQPNIIKISALSQFSAFLQQEMLRLWILNQGFLPPSRQQLAKIYTEVILANVDRQPYLKIAQYGIMRYRDQLYIYPVTYINTLKLMAKWSWKLGSLVIYHGFTGKNQDRLPTDNNVDFKLAKAKKIFQHLGIPPWLRVNYPLVVKNNKLIAILGLWNKEL